MGDSGAGGHFICSSISPDLATSRTLLEDSQQTPGPCRSAGLGWAGLVLGSFTYKRSIWSFIKAGTRTRLGSRLTPGPASPDAAAGTRLHREPHLFLFSQVSVKFYHHGGPADDVTSWPAVAAAPSSQLWGCDDDDSAGTLPQSSVARSRPSTSHHPWTLQLQHRGLGWARI